MDGDFAFRPINPLNIGFDTACTDTKIDEFYCPAGATCTDFNGQPLPRAPKWNFTVISPAPLH